MTTNSKIEYFDYTNYCLYAEHWHLHVCEGTMCHHPNGTGDCYYTMCNMRDCKLFKENTK